MAGGNRKRFSKAKSRKPVGSSAARSLFVEGGLLADWQLETPSPKGRNPRNGGGNSTPASRSRISDGKKASGSGSKIESKKPSANAIGYEYPLVGFQESSFENGSKAEDNHLDGQCPIVLGDSKETQVVAYIDQTPSTEFRKSEITYDYSSFSLDDTSHRGLGFSDGAEATPSGIGSSSQIEEQEGSAIDLSPSDVEMDTDLIDTFERGTKLDNLPVETSSSKENSGFLSIGNVKLYTQDVSDEEDDEDSRENSLYEESLESSESGDSPGSSDSDDYEDTSDSGTDIDDDVAEDYFMGIGGIDKVLDVKQLLKEVVDDDISGGSFDETVEKLSGIALQDASKDYGLKKPQSRSKKPVTSYKTKFPQFAQSSDLNDFMFVKDPRSGSARKKFGARFTQSWPSEAHKSKNFRKFPVLLFQVKKRNIGKNTLQKSVERE